MASEYWGGGYRNALSCLGHIPYCIGLMLFPALAWLVPASLGWRPLALLAFVPAVPYYIYARCLPLCCVHHIYREFLKMLCSHGM